MQTTENTAHVPQGLREPRFQATSTQTEGHAGWPAADLSAVELSPPCELPRRTLRYLAQQLFTPAERADTGLEALPLRDFMELARSRRAFYHATETSLRTGWWSTLFARDFLASPASAPFQDYLKRHFQGGAVVEIGPGDQIRRHCGLTRRAFGASHYLSVDLNEESKKHGAAHSDSLSFLSLMKSASVNAIVAFGVFNEPMSLQFPAEAPPRFFLPAKGKDDATRAHCEHEYVRRLAREIVRVLKPGGVLLGDGLHSRGFETEVRTYLLRAGLMPHLPGFETLSEVPRGQFRIFDPFFFTKE